MRASLGHTENYKGGRKTTKKIKAAIVGLLMLGLLSGLAIAQTFNFVFNQTKYEPSGYLWEESWTVETAVDFIEAVLTITGPGYQNVIHGFDLTFTNVAPIVEDYILDNFDYAVKWIVGVEEETLIQGNFGDILLVSETVQYTGTLSPSLAGTGSIAVDISNIVWTESESITWTYDLQDPNNVEPDYVTVDSFTIVGATQTYFETGQVQIEFSSGGVNSYVTFDLTIPEVGTLNFDFQMVTGDHDLFTYDFEPLTTGGALTVTLTLITQHS